MEDKKLAEPSLNLLEENKRTGFNDDFVQNDREPPTDNKNDIFP